ncbi:TonB-dependent receptor domain-containing protein [Sphingomonas morindae]|uniref:TonB-dependent receptor n=1 Tax=Sphingomonas morindae TaxID=1541170 RepID=A0ABY4X8W7_9SPHN|nr:TonB-dependent receptor [Sphingomonas morindae]USI73323.1 TonB-dependent receptor [Sphingomonas morindae]
MLLTALSAGTAWAQAEAPLAPEAAADNAAAQPGAIIVTGSRIARADLTSAAPITVVTAQDFALRGAVNVETVLNSLPQVVSGTTAFSNNPGDGAVTLSLRNLGASRTLVLLNGRRWMFYDTGQIVDLNTIPAFLIESVETTTGGASAVYGSDAVAGVVNFKLRKSVNGFEVGGQYGLTGRGDGRRYEIHGAVGGAFAEGRGHVTLFGEYYRRASVFQGDRDFSRTTFTDAFDDQGRGYFAPGGSRTIPQGRFFTPDGAGTNFAGLGAIFDKPGDPSRPFNKATDSYNYAPVNFLMLPQERWLIGGYADYQLNDGATVYGEFSYVNNQVAAALAPTPVTGAFVFDVAKANTVLAAADQLAVETIAARQLANGGVSAGQVKLNIGRRIVETGLRKSLDERNAYRLLAGIRGDLTDRLHYDAYYSFARTRNANMQEGNISHKAFQAALLDGSMNIFGPGTISKDSLEKISILAQNQTMSQLQVATATVSGELFGLGLGAAPIGFAAGVERRSVSSRFIPDTALSSGDVLGFNAGKPTEGGYDVTEGFTELNIPVVADQPLLKLVELHGAARYSTYSVKGIGAVWTYAGDFKWSPVENFTVRGQFQRAIRAPNVENLYGGVGDDNPSLTDPCATAAALAPGKLRDVCIATGVPAASLGQPTVQPNVQIPATTGGNPNLSAETSTSYTIGGIFSPRAVPGFHVTADYYAIEVKDAIADFGGGAGNVFAQCYLVIQDAGSPYCRAIHRNPRTGSLDGSLGPDGTVYVLDTRKANIGSFVVRGVDVQADYGRALNFSLTGAGQSKISATFAGSWTTKLEAYFGPGTTRLNCAGKFGALCKAALPTGQPQSTFKSTMRISYSDGPVLLSTAWRHLSQVRDDDPANTYVVERVGAVDYFDLALMYKLREGTNITLGVNNLLDRTPPIMGDNQEQSNTYPSVYDALGRDFFVALNFRF